MSYATQVGILNAQELIVENVLYWAASAGMLLPQAEKAANNAVAGAGAVRLSKFLLA